MADVEGLQLGGGEKQEFVVRYHIFAERSKDSKKLSDIINNQYHKKMCLYNINTCPNQYTYHGFLASGALTYPQLADYDGQYFWTYANIEDTAGGPRDSSTNVYRAELNQTIIIDRYVGTY